MMFVRRFIRAMERMENYVCVCVFVSVCMCLWVCATHEYASDDDTDDFQFSLDYISISRIKFFGKFHKMWKN